MPSRIALCGLAGSGKSTAADYFVSRHGYKRLSYAAPIKRMMRALLIEAGASLVETIEMTDGKLKELPTSYLCGHSTRYAMQTLGTEFGRNIIGQDIWRRILLNKVSEFPRVVVDDLRFPNEAESLKAEGFIIVRIIRADSGTNSAHSSEQQQFDVDLTITNDGLVADFHAQLEGLL
jgi:hypothetical protein